MSEKKSIGAAIDEIISALSELNEPTRVIAVKAACEHLGINLGGVNSKVAQISPQRATITEQNDPANAATPAPNRIKDIRTLKDEKEPSSAIEMACLVAYYIENYAIGEEQAPDINKSDIEKYFKQAGFPLPKAVSQTLIDTKSAGYMDSSSTRGRYKLNPVGHNLVAHSLPRKKK